MADDARHRTVGGNMAKSWAQFASWSPARSIYLLGTHPVVFRNVGVGRRLRRSGSQPSV